MRRVIAILAFFLAATLAVQFSPVFGQKEQAKKSWAGKLGGGTAITEEDLKRILAEHVKWLRSSNKEGLRANFRAADLTGVDLSKADLSMANLSRANLSKANLSNAFVIEVDLSDANLNGTLMHGANLDFANLSRAHLLATDLSDASLREASLFRADLTGADLTGADLTEANLKKADLSNTKLQRTHAEFAVFEETKFENAETSDFSFIGARGLTKIDLRSPAAVANLRKNAKKYGFRNEERVLTSVLHKYQMENRNAFEKFFDKYVLGGKLTDYGAEPWNSLKLLLILIVPFSILYTISLYSLRRMTGIWLVRNPDRVIKSLGDDRPIKLTPVLFPGFLPYEKMRSNLEISSVGILKIGFHFSILSTFSIGWRELNFGVWITRLQRQEYTLRATGWVRTVSGIQSLLSIYLLALWVLTYFGRPFE